MSWETALDRQIHNYLPDLKWAADEPMAKHTSFRIGGPAKRMAFPKTREQLVVLMGFLQDAGVKPLLIGNGTNLLVADKGVQPIQLPAAQDRSQQDGQQHKVKRQRRQKERAEPFGVQKDRRGDQNIADGRRQDQRDLHGRDERRERIAQAVPEWFHGASVDENRAGAG